jgi:predicted PhzF superfamily epimerase YddE/YHI9
MYSRRRRSRGNPLAIFPDAGGLNDAELQALAREMNLSETTFVFPRDPASEAREGKKVRIFTVESELPFAGHPTLGTALYLYASEPNQTKPAEITLDLKAGKIPCVSLQIPRRPGMNEWTVRCSAKCLIARRRSALGSAILNSERHFRETTSHASSEFRLTKFLRNGRSNRSRQD